MDGGDEAIAAGVEGLDVARGVGRVAERAADLRDGLLEDGVGREHVGPDLIQKLFLGDDAFAVADEVAQNLYGARLDLHRRAVAQQEVNV